MWVRCGYTVCSPQKKKKIFETVHTSPQGTGESPDSAKLLLFSWLYSVPARTSAWEACATTGVCCFLGQKKERTSEELRKGKRMKNRLHYPVRGHASRQSFLQARGCPGHHKTALQFHPHQQNQACLPCRIPCSPATDPANQLSLPAMILACVSIDLLIFRSYEFDPFHTEKGMAKMWTYTCNSEGWWNTICFCKKYQGHPKHRNTIQLW